MNSSNGQGPAPRVGALIALIFGLVFVEADAGGMARGLQTIVRVGGIIVALTLFYLIRVRVAAGSRGRLSSRYWTIVAVEVVALLAGIAVINAVFHAHELTVPWIAVVVGLHFFGFVSLWQARSYAVLGVAVTALGLAGFALYAAGASAVAIRVVSGVCSGLALYLAVANSLLRQRRTEAARQTET